MLKDTVNKILTSPKGNSERPYLNKDLESSTKGIYIIGDLAGASVIKHAMAHGHAIIEHISSFDKSTDDDILDIIIAGAGASGLNAALSAKAKKLSFIMLEKNEIASTIKNFPEGKWIYSEPDDTPTVGHLWFDGAKKEDIINKWHKIISDNSLPINTNEGLSKIKKGKDYFTVTSSKGLIYKAKRIIIATGQRGEPKKLGTSGEDKSFVYHRLYSPTSYAKKDILVVGGGNSAVEAAIVLSSKNKVYLSYRKDSFSRLFKDNKRLLAKGVKENKIELILESEVEEFKENKALIKTKASTKTIDIDYAFVLIGSIYPSPFLKGLGIKMENDWSSVRGSMLLAFLLMSFSFLGLWLGGGYSSLSFIPMPKILGFSLSFICLSTLLVLGLRANRYASILLVFFIVYSIYGIKLGDGLEFWPYKFWGYNLLSFADKPWNFWYTVLYSALMIIFGVQAMIRWGFNKNDQFHIWRYISLISFQLLFFFLIPEFLFQWAVEYKVLGETLSTDPAFTGQSFRAYGIVYAWPLFFYTFFYDPHVIWIVWGIFLSFILIPILTIWQGKRYCSWVCGCGGLAETLGDRWRHLAPKGKLSIKLETANTVILIFAVLTTIFMLTKDTISLFQEPADYSMAVYRVLVDVWFAGILPITLYPFLGGRVWCRYFCPLAKLMELSSALFTRIKRFGYFSISANNKCISCGDCSRYCQMGIDVMSFAMKQESVNNINSSCVGCGICITVCPMDVLSFKKN